LYFMSCAASEGAEGSTVSERGGSGISASLTRRRVAVGGAGGAGGVAGASGAGVSSRFAALARLLVAFVTAWAGRLARLRVVAATLSGGAGVSSSFANALQATFSICRIAEAHAKRATLQAAISICCIAEAHAKRAALQASTAEQSPDLRSTAHNRGAGMQGCRDAGMQGCRDAGMQGCRDAGMQGCRDALT
jgi:hypothetical protein